MSSNKIFSKSAWMIAITVGFLLHLGCASKSTDTGSSSNQDSAQEDGGRGADGAAGTGASATLDNSLFEGSKDEDASTTPAVSEEALMHRRSILLRAPKRKAEDRIFVALLPMVLDYEADTTSVKEDARLIAQTNQTFEDISEVIRAYMANEPLFKMISGTDLGVITDPMKETNTKERRRAYVEKDRKGPNLEVMRYPHLEVNEEFFYNLHEEHQIPADVVVVPHVWLSVKAPGALGKAGAGSKSLHFNAKFRVHSAYQTIDFTSEFSFPMSLKEDSLEKISRELTKVIKDRVAPYLPDRNAIQGTILH